MDAISVKSSALFNTSKDVKIKENREKCFDLLSSCLPYPKGLNEKLKKKRLAFISTEGAFCSFEYLEGTGKNYIQRSVFLEVNKHGANLIMKYNQAEFKDLRDPLVNCSAPSKVKLCTYQETQLINEYFLGCRTKHYNKSLKTDSSLVDPIDIVYPFMIYPGFREIWFYYLNENDMSLDFYPEPTSSDGIMLTQSPQGQRIQLAYITIESKYNDENQAYESANETQREAMSAPIRGEGLYEIEAHFLCLLIVYCMSKNVAEIEHFLTILKNRSNAFIGQFLTQDLRIERFKEIVEESFFINLGTRTIHMQDIKRVIYDFVIKSEDVHLIHVKQFIVKAQMSMFSFIHFFLTCADRTLAHINPQIVDETVKYMKRYETLISCYGENWGYHKLYEPQSNLTAILISKNLLRVLSYGITIIPIIKRC